MTQELGYKDILMHCLAGTKAENTPCYFVELKDSVDYSKLKKAVEVTLEVFPLMKCIITYDDGICYKTIGKKYPIVNSKIEERFRVINAGANGYMWQITYYDRYICLDGAHSISDGRGWMSFFTTLINAYYGVLPSNNNSKEDFMENKLIPGVETFAKRKQQKGFRRKSICYNKKGDKRAQCHLLVANMQQVLDAVHKIDSTPAVVFAPIFSRTLRKFINPKAKNKNVSCLMPIDVRGILDFDTTHNGFSEAYITYLDKFDNYEIGKLSTIYRAMLDLQVQPESVMNSVSKQIKKFKPKIIRNSKVLLRLGGLIGGTYVKNTQCNFVITYLGKSYFDKKIEENIEAYYVHSWHQFQDCNIAMVDYDGMLYITIIEDYVEGDDIVKEFVKDCGEIGIELIEKENRTIDFVSVV